MARSLLSDDGSKVEEIEEIEPQDSRPVKERRHEAAAKLLWTIKDSNDDAMLICKIVVNKESTDGLVSALDKATIRGTGQIKNRGYKFSEIKWEADRGGLIGTWFIYNFYPSADMREMKEVSETLLRAVR